MQLQAWQPKEGGLLATGGEDGKLLIYNVLDTIEGVPYMCVPCASAELPEEGLTQIAWGSDNQLYTGHTSGESWVSLRLFECVLSDEQSKPLQANSLRFQELLFS